jgi:hypothetical protein
MEIIDNCVEVSKQIKKVDSNKIVAPKPKKNDSLSIDLLNPDMNL